MPNKITIEIEESDRELFLKALKVIEKEVDKLEKQLIGLGRPLTTAAELRSRIQELRQALL